MLIFYCFFVKNLDTFYLLMLYLTVNKNKKDQKMKKFNLSLVAVLAMSTFAIAGGDIAPVEEPVVVVEEPAPVGNFYIGGAYAWQAVKIKDGIDDFEYIDSNFGGIMIDAGYKFNPYVAVEGRYRFGLSSSNTLGWTNNLPSDITVDSWGILC